jgi:serine/threonine-protein kinase
VIGAGGMGVVFEATHLELEQRVAVKVLRDEMASDATLVERFLREARAVARLRTEHVCRVFDVGRQDDGAPYIVMELLGGNDLASAIADRPLPAPVAVEYIMQACVALAEAHAAGIVHRDLKPHNLFVTRRPDGGALVKVLDFGIAKAAADARLTSTASAIGTPAYMSPEQIQSARDVDVRADIWALGVTLYQLVSGRLPFYSQRLADVAIKVATAPPDPIDVDPALHAVLWRCLEKDPARRYASVAELVAELAPLGRAPAAVSVAAPPPARKRRAWIVILVAALAVGGAIAAVAALTGGGGAPSSPDAAVARVAVAPPPAPPPVDSPPPPAVDAAPSAVDAAPPPVDALGPPPPLPHELVGNPFLTPEYRKKLRGGLGVLEGLAKSSDPKAREQGTLGVVVMACMLGDAATAKQYYALLAADKDRTNAHQQCAALHVTVP